MRVYATVAAKPAADVKEGDVLAKADGQASAVRVLEALSTERKTWFDNKCFKVQDRSKGSNT
eukprot:9021307-Pyramimonas_sp.AAC.1